MEREGEEREKRGGEKILSTATAKVHRDILKHARHGTASRAAPRESQQERGATTRSPIASGRPSMGCVLSRWAAPFHATNGGPQWGFKELDVVMAGWLVCHRLFRADDLQGTHQTLPVSDFQRDLDNGAHWSVKRPGSHSVPGSGR